MSSNSPPSPPPSSAFVLKPPDAGNRNRNSQQRSTNHHQQQQQRPQDTECYRYSITGKAAHERIAPLLPPNWIDCSPYHHQNQNQHKNEQQQQDVQINDEDKDETHETVHNGNHRIHNNGRIERNEPTTPNDNNDNGGNDATAATAPPGPIIHFVWENAPRHETKSFRDSVRCYSHLPNGIDVLDDKWALARLLVPKSLAFTSTLTTTAQQQQQLEQRTGSSLFAPLESHCFRGPLGFESFCKRVGIMTTLDRLKEEDVCRDDYSIAPSSSNSTTTTATTTKKKRKKTTLTKFPDLLHRPTASNAATKTSAQTPPFPKTPPNLWVIKDAKSNGAGGIWMIDSTTAPSLLAASITNTTATDNTTPPTSSIPTITPASNSPVITPLIDDHRYVAQRYAWPPILYGGRKCHVRVYVVLCSDGSAFVHRRAFLHVANELFRYTDPEDGVDGEDDGLVEEKEGMKREGGGANSSASSNSSGGGLLNNEVHITNCCANSDDANKFSGEICADFNQFPIDNNDGSTTTTTSNSDDNDPYASTVVVPLAEFFPSIAASVAQLTKRVSPFVKGGEANNGFEYLGLDFILSYRQRTQPQQEHDKDDTDTEEDETDDTTTDTNDDETNNKGGGGITPNTLLPIAYLLEVNSPPSQDTATGLPHAEKLHDDVLRDLVHMWIVPKVMMNSSSSAGDGGNCASAIRPGGNDTNININTNGGWKCVVLPSSLSSSNEDNSKSNTTSAMMVVPSKAVILNKIRWAIFERKALQQQQQQIADIVAARHYAQNCANAVVVAGHNNADINNGNNNINNEKKTKIRTKSGEEGGREDDGTTTNIGELLPPAPSAKAITTFARRQFPFFTTPPQSHHDEADDNDGGEFDLGGRGETTTIKCKSKTTTKSNKVIFLENAGGSQVPQTVIDSMVDSLSYRHRSSVGSRSKDDARRILLAILGATTLGRSSSHDDDNDGVDVEEDEDSSGDGEQRHLLFLGPNATTLFEKLAQKYVEGGVFFRGEGEVNEIVIASDNHLANVTPWVNLARVTGAVIKWWICTGHHSNDPVLNDNDDDVVEKKVNNNIITTSTNLSSLLTDQTRIVTISHSSNILLGSILNIKRLCQTVKKRCPRAHVIVDGVALVPHVFAAVRDSGVDWYVVSCHKLFGPHVGGLCGRRRALWDMFYNSDGGGKGVGAGSQCRGIDGNETNWKDEDIYRSWETGTLSYEACAGIRGLGRYFSNLASLATNGSNASTTVTTTTATNHPLVSYCSGGCTDGCGAGGLPSGEISMQTRSVIPPLSYPSSFSHSMMAEAQIQQAYKYIRTAEDSCFGALIPRLEACPNVRLLSRELVGEDKDAEDVYSSNYSSSTTNHDSSKVASLRIPIVSFVHEKIDSKRIVDMVFQEGGIVIRQGTFLANDVLLNCLGLLDGFVRISFCHYNTVEETRRLIEVLECIDGW